MTTVNLRQGKEETKKTVSSAIFNKEEIKRRTLQASIRKPNPNIESIKKSLKEISSVSTSIADGLEKIVSIIIEEDLSSLESFPALTVIVPKSSTGHNYTVGEPCLLIENGLALKLTGSMGNNLSMNSDIIRFATAEEIDYFFEEFEKHITK